MHSSRRFRANSPKGEDAKPPVYGTLSTYDSGVAGSNVNALSRARSRARIWVVRPTHSSSRCLPHPVRAASLARPQGSLDRTWPHSLIPSGATYRARDAVGSPLQLQRVPCASV